MKVKSTIYFISGILVLGILLAGVNAIRSYKRLRREIGKELYGALSDIKHSRLDAMVSHPGNGVREDDKFKSDVDGLSIANLRLLGTILGEPATACIKDLDLGTEGMYKVSDKIAGMEIVDIKLGRVILEKNGRRIALTFTEKETAITKLSSVKMVINKSGLLREIVNGLDKELSMAKIVPHFDFASKSFSGFRIVNVKDGSIAEKAGFRNGDIVKILNGQELSSPKRAIQIFRKVRNQSQIDIGLLRKNRLINLSYQIRG